MFKSSSLVLTLLLIGVASGCKKKSQRSDFPNVSFEEYVYLNNPSSYDLGVPGGAIFHTGGYRGLIIYRRYLNGGIDDFAIYDRACPEHYAENCSQLELSNDGLFAICPCGNEKYLLFDGSPVDEATISLFPYSASLSNNVLYIRN